VRKGPAKATRPAAGAVTLRPSGTRQVTPLLCMPKRVRSPKRVATAPRTGMAMASRGGARCGA